MLDLLLSKAPPSKQDELRSLIDLRGLSTNRSILWRIPLSSVLPLSVVCQLLGTMFVISVERSSRLYQLLDASYVAWEASKDRMLLQVLVPYLPHLAKSCEWTISVQTRFHLYTDMKVLSSQSSGLHVAYSVIQDAAR
ncbi:hypothetical protein NL676_014405 [Syzygium grande]|nr:hypothetical protein NL676_014405 [Syzygium grande]